MKSLLVASLLAGWLPLLVGCIPAEPTAAPGDASVTATGGRSAGSGGGGTTAGSGGSSTSASGGSTASGGGQGSGGLTGVGSGGTGSGTGGGGGNASGGGGGRESSSGGSGGSGAAAGRGAGGSATGGANTGTGGGGGTGGGTGGSGAGGSGTGGATATACNLPNHTGTGSFTYYYFSQGSAKEGNGYRTACGYYGTANGTTDTIQNIASMTPASATYFAAIPGTNGFNTSARCGSCVEITGQNGKVIIATVADECPYGSDGGNTICGNNPNGHLDLSKAAFDQLGYSKGDPTGTNWKYVPCPVTGNVVARVKSGNSNELYVENSILAITAVEGATRTSYGAWHFNDNLASGQSLNLTDAAGRKLTIQLQGTTQNMNQDTGKQFPKCQ